MSGSPESLARLTLLGALAAAQLTLASRAGELAFSIMAGLSWLGGGLLLIEREQRGQLPAVPQVPAGRFAAGLMLLLWTLLVLSGAGRLYDPLFWAVPLAVLAGLALVGGVAWRSRLFGELLLIGALLPAQGLFNALWPVDPLAVATARITAMLLWLVGRPAYAAGPAVVLHDQVLLVDASCTGHTTLSFCFATLALLLVLLPLRHPRVLVVLAPALLLAVFLLNAVRITLLAYTVPDPGLAWWQAWRGFEFWHDGSGAQLFALLASGLVCAVYVALQEWELRRRGRAAR